MNGRIYSPELGRMLSPDPITQAPENGQNYNRYTYAFNNPLRYTDPSGYYTFCASDGFGDKPGGNCVGPASSGNDVSPAGGGGELGDINLSNWLGDLPCTGGLSQGQVCPPRLANSDLLSGDDATPRIEIDGVFRGSSQEAEFSSLLNNGWDGTTEITFFGRRPLAALGVYRELPMEIWTPGINNRLYHEHAFGVVFRNGEPNIVNRGFFG